MPHIHTVETEPVDGWRTWAVFGGPQPETACPLCEDGWPYEVYADDDRHGEATTLAAAKPAPKG